jgi:3-methyladenine DNA glycosylase/8-oxoguanine DNA glycosylase
MVNPRSAVRYLKRTDPVLAKVIAAVGPCRFELRSQGTHYQALTRAIVYQQLSGKAAGTILGRFNALYASGAPTPEEVLKTDDAQLRTVGLSRQKVSYLKDLSAKVAGGDLPLEAIHEMSDAEVVTHLVQVKGIGQWSAQMFLMFRLGRPDVLPELDLGIQNAIRRAYKLRKRPTPKQVRRIGTKWSPHTTIACWYLWRSLDNGDGQLGK